jgi:hypothetical protein
VELRDAVTGEVLDVYDGGGRPWWHEPAHHFTGFAWQAMSYVAFRNPWTGGYTVLRLTRSGLQLVCAPEASDAEEDFIDAVVPVVLDGGLAMLTCGMETVAWRAWPDGEWVLRIWRTPPRWRDPRPVVLAGRPYVWLSVTDFDDVPAEDRWRIPESFDHQLWDLTSDAPVGAPLRMRGYLWGPWHVGTRPLMLCKVDWRDLQVWDLGRREALGPGLGDLDIANPSLGLAHGRPVLAATVDTSLLIFDLHTGRRVASQALPDTPIATTVDPAGTAWAITGTGHLTRLHIRATDIHPCAIRRRSTTKTTST